MSSLIERVRRFEGKFYRAGGVTGAAVDAPPRASALARQQENWRN
jgi:hypothetical protein